MKNNKKITDIMESLHKAILNLSNDLCKMRDVQEMEEYCGEINKFLPELANSISENDPKAKEFMNDIIIKNLGDCLKVMTRLYRVLFTALISND